MIANIGGILDTLPKLGTIFFTITFPVSFHEKTTNKLHTRFIIEFTPPTTIAALLHNS